MFLNKIESTDVFQALADRTRVRIMRIMVSIPGADVCLCDMTEALGEPESNVSRHLKALRQTGLLDAEKEGRWVYHRLVPSGTVDLFYDLLRGLPDSDGTFAKDVAKFKIERKKRVSARCRRGDEPSRSVKNLRSSKL